MNLLVTLDWREQQWRIGQLTVFATRGRERYQFQYDTEWVSAPLRFAIDPALELSTRAVYSSASLWGAFQDISPDRWGRLVQDRASGAYISDSGYMLGVSDTMRLGALRLSEVEHPEIYLAAHQEVPKLVQLRTLENAIQRLEAGQETAADLALLAQPGSSLGGARPKAVIEDGGELWMAKFQSRLDTERMALWEAVMLDLCQQAQITTPAFRLLNHASPRPVLLSKRFDRDGEARIPFMSAMTLLERDEASRAGASYLEIADAISRYSSQPQADKQELWRRMTFNVLTGNTDDHLRNHGFLRELQGWRLSPVYDVNPNYEPYARRVHALSFDGERNRPSLAVCCELAPYFDVTATQQRTMLTTLGRAVAHWRVTAQRYGLSANEVERMAAAFEHSDQQAIS